MSTMFAEEAEKNPVSFQINHPALYYSSSKNSDDSGTQKIQQAETSSSLTELVVNARGYHLHLFPASQGAPIQIGLDAMDGLELGFTLSHNSKTQKDLNYDWQSSLEGVYAAYALPVFGTNFEFVLGFDFYRSSSKEQGETDIVRSKVSGTDQYYGLNVVFPITGSLSYMLTTTVINSQERDSVTSQKSRASFVGFSPFSIRLDL